MATKIYNRTPLFVNTPGRNDSSSKYFNHNVWKGLVDNENFLNVDQQTFSSCNNVYVNDKGLLKSRPSLKNDYKKVKLESYPDGIILTGYDDVKNYTDVQVYIKLTLLGLEFIFSNKNFDFALAETIPYNEYKIVQVQDTLLIFVAQNRTTSSIYKYDIKTNKLFEVTDEIYLPVKTIITNGVHKDNESPNILTKDYLINYVFDSSQSFDMFSILGKDVKVFINGGEYVVDNFSELDAELLFVKKAHVSSNIYANKYILGATRKDVKIPLAYQSDDGSVIYNDITSKIDNTNDNRVNNISSAYYSLDSKIFIRLPQIDNLVTPVKISKDGKLAVALKKDGLYVYSLYSENENNTLKYPVWTNIITNEDKHALEVQGTPLDSLEFEAYYKGTKEMPTYNLCPIVNFEMISENNYVIFYADKEHILAPNYYEKVLENGNIEETLLTSLPSYFKQWPSTTYFKTLKKYNNIIVSVSFTLDDVGITDYQYVLPSAPPIVSTDVVLEDTTNNKRLFYAVIRPYSITQTCRYYYITNYAQIAMTAEHSALFSGHMGYLPLPEEGAENELIYLNPYCCDIKQVASGNYGILYYLCNQLTNEIETYYCQVGTTINNTTYSVSPNKAPVKVGTGIGKLMEYESTYEDRFHSAALTINSIIKDGVTKPLLFNVDYIVNVNKTNKLLLKDFYLYDNNYEKTLITIQEKVVSSDKAYFFPDYVTKLNDYYFAYDNIICMSKQVKDNKLYIPEISIQKFEEDITNLHPISKTEVAIFHENYVNYVAYDYELDAYRYFKSKLQTGCKKGNDIITTYDGTSIIYSTKRGLVAMSYQQFIASDEQALTYISDNIYDLYKQFTLQGDIKILKHSFWIIVYKQHTKSFLMLDTRNYSWWPISLENEIVSLYSDDEDLFAIVVKHSRISQDFEDTTVTAKFNNSESNYYDFLDKLAVNDTADKHEIDWHFQSQKLHLNSPNYFKHISSIIFNNVMGTTNPLSFRLSVKNYRSDITSQRPDFASRVDNGNFIDETDDVDNDSVKIVEYKVDSICTFVQRVNFSKVTEFQYLLSADISKATQVGSSRQVPMSLSNITVKYKITSEAR